jgi:hypothetical protein
MFCEMLEMIVSRILIAFLYTVYVPVRNGI